MSLNIKLTDSGSVVTFYNPKQRIYFTRPAHTSELNVLYEYGEEWGLTILSQRINSKRFNGRAYQ